MSTVTDPRSLEQQALRTARALADAEASRGRFTNEPLVPGDLVVDRQTADFPVEWAVIDQETRDAAESPSGGQRRLLVVPADTLPLRGGADVAVATDPGGSLTLRAAFGVWVEEGRLDATLRCGHVPAEAAESARARHIDYAAGRLVGTPLEREAEADSEYLHWVDTVLRPARSTLADGLLASGRPVEMVSPLGAEAERHPPLRRWRRLPRLHGDPWALAASVLLVVALGLAGGYLWQRAAFQELRVSQRDLSQSLADLQAERLALLEDSQRRNAQHRREIAEREQAALEAEGGHRDRLAALELRLSEAMTPMPRVNVPFEWLRPVEAVRGQPASVEIPPTADQLVLILQFTGAERYQTFGLALYPEGHGRPTWEGSGLVKTGPVEFTVVLPRSLLAPGVYRLALLGIRETGEQVLAAEYEFQVE